MCTFMLEKWSLVKRFSKDYHSIVYDWNFCLFKLGEAMNSRDE